MSSFARFVRNVYRVGPRDAYQQLMHLNDVKAGRFIGADQFGNKYFENMNPREEVPGRQRWVIFAQDSISKQYYEDNSQVPPEWHSWLQHIRALPPTEDPVVQNLSPPWKQQWTENISGTRGAYRSYNTVKPKIEAWEPKTAARA
ncbi:NDUFA12-domain-containing protein [Schizophyllum commune Tattone D]|nr:NDUFA12-domain-containing protein [Schizophyllum commune Loenen D]KAI5828879.1 NDUFA12-domain-containing protein [Schizophyllum commune Tattone D]